VRKATSASGAVTTAIEPHAGSAASTFSEERKRPWAAPVRRNALRLAAAPTTCRSPFQSFFAFDPSMPTKFGSERHTEVSTAALARLRSSTRKTATGRPLASGSAGTRGFMALRWASTGSSGSARRTRPKG
jgi:hypothetical protein